MRLHGLMLFQMSERKLMALLPVGVVALSIGLMVMLTRMRPQLELQPPVPVHPVIETLQIEAASPVVWLPAQGAATAPTESRLSTKVSGMVEWVHPDFEAGAAVNSGEVLLKIDALPYAAALAEAQSRLATAELALASEQAAADQALRDWQRVASGQPDPLVARIPQLAKARADLAAARSSVENARSQLEYCSVKAPFNGRITARMVSAGQSVAAYSTILGTLIDSSIIEIPLPLPLAEAQLLPLDEQGLIQGDVAVRLSAAAGGLIHHWSAKLDRIDAGADTRTRMLRVYARLDPPFLSDHGWRMPLGLFVEARIQARPLEDGFLLPRGALRSGNTVQVLQVDQTLKAIPVTIVQSMSDNVIVRGELQEGDRINLTPLLYFVEGMQVEP